MAEFIKLPRSWLDPQITGHDDFLKAVVYLAREINEQGSVKFSSGDAKMRFGMSARRYRTFMQIITSDKQTDKQTTNKTTNISFDCQEVTPTKRQAKRQTSDKQTDKQKTQKFTPPTSEEVNAYVLEKGYHFNPEQFVPFYQSKGWMIGKNLMKDWRAACQTWELEWKKKYGEQFYYQIQQPASGARDRLAGLRDATAAILQQPGNIDSYFNDNG